MIPMMQILFGTTKKTYNQPKYEGISELKSFVEEFFNFKVTQYLEQDAGLALLFVIVMVIFLFFLKNISNYLAMFFITFLRNGILKDIRNSLYNKNYFSTPEFFYRKEKR